MSHKRNNPGEGKKGSNRHDEKENREMDNVKDNIHVTGEVETRLPPELAKKRETAKEKQEVRDKLRFGVEVAGLVFIIIYAGLTAWTASSTQDQLKVSQRSFLVGERPWVSIVFPGNTSLTGAFIPVTVGVRNTGKTPAENVQGDVIFTVANEGEDITLGDFSVGHPHNRIYTGLLFAGDAPILGTFPVSSYGASMPQTIVPDDQLRQDLASGRKYLIYYGKITYSDALGIQHWTQFCTGANVSSVINVKRCVAYNQVDHNEK